MKRISKVIGGIVIVIVLVLGLKTIVNNKFSNEKSHEKVDDNSNNKGGIKKIEKNEDKSKTLKTNEDVKVDEDLVNENEKKEKAESSHKKTNKVEKINQNENTEHSHKGEHVDKEKINIIYTVKFLDDKDNVIKIEKVKEGLSANAPKIPEKEGYQFKMWSNNLENVKSDLIVKPIYEANRFSVSFRDTDGTLISTERIAYGNPVKFPVYEIKEGEHFIEWSKLHGSGSQNIVLGDIEFEAKTGVNTLTVLFENEYGQSVYEKTYNYGEKITLDEQTNQEKEGFDFIDYGASLPKVAMPLSPKETLKVKVRYEIKKFDVTILDEEGKNQEVMKVDWNTPISSIKHKEKEGYEFIGWNTKDKVIKKNITLAPKYKIKSFTVNIDVAANRTNQNAPFESKSIKQEVNYGDSVDIKQLSLPTSKSHTLSTDLDVLKNIKENKSIKLVYDINNFEIEFEITDEIIKKVSVDYGQDINLKNHKEFENIANENAINGTTFAYWTLSKKEVNVLNNVQKDYKLNAQYMKKTIKVYFNDYNGNPINEYTTTVEWGDNLKESLKEGFPSINEMNKEYKTIGYTFTGWNNLDQTVNTKDDFIVINGNYEVKNVKVTPIARGEKVEKYAKPGLFDSYTIQEGKILSTLAPSVEGHSKSKSNYSGSPILQDIIIEYDYEIDKNQVRFLIGDKVIDTQEVQYGDDAVAPEIENEEGFEFYGWIEEFHNIKNPLDVHSNYSLKKYDVVSLKPVLLEEDNNTTSEQVDAFSKYDNNYKDFLELEYNHFDKINLKELTHKINSENLIESHKIIKYVDTKKNKEFLPTDTFEVTKDVQLEVVYEINKYKVTLNAVDDIDKYEEMNNPYIMSNKKDKTRVTLVKNHGQTLTPEETTEYFKEFSESHDIVDRLSPVIVDREMLMNLNFNIKRYAVSVSANSIEDSWKSGVSSYNNIPFGHKIDMKKVNETFNNLGLENHKGYKQNGLWSVNNEIVKDTIENIVKEDTEIIAQMILKEYPVKTIAKVETKGGYIEIELGKTMVKYGQKLKLDDNYLLTHRKLKQYQNSHNVKNAQWSDSETVLDDSMVVTATIHLKNEEFYNVKFSAIHPSTKRELLGFGHGIKVVVNQDGVPTEESKENFDKMMNIKNGNEFYSMGGRVFESWDHDVIKLTGDRTINANFDHSKNRREFDIKLEDGTTRTVIGEVHDEGLRGFNLISDYRQTKNVNNDLYRYSDKLSEYALLRAAEASIKFEHARPDGTMFNSGFTQIGSQYAGENIAKGSGSYEGTIQQWVKSPAHNSFLLNKNTNSVGLAMFKTEHGLGVSVYIGVSAETEDQISIK